jgi:hypothetical protein
MTTPLAGGCLCGAVRYTLTAPITAWRACHCKDCQKASGTLMGVNAIVPASGFTITKGKPRCFKVKGDCGSPIYSHREISPERLVLRSGSLDAPPAVKLTAHIWTASARPWSYIEPATEQHPGNPPA